MVLWYLEQLFTSPYFSSSEYIFKEIVFNPSWRWVCIESHSEDTFLGWSLNKTTKFFKHFYICFWYVLYNSSISKVWNTKTQNRLICYNTFRSKPSTQTGFVMKRKWWFSILTMMFLFTVRIKVAIFVIGNNKLSGHCSSWTNLTVIHVSSTNMLINISSSLVTGFFWQFWENVLSNLFCWCGNIDILIRQITLLICFVVSMFRLLIFSGDANQYMFCKKAYLVICQTFLLIVWLGTESSSLINCFTLRV